MACSSTSVRTTHQPDAVACPPSTMTTTSSSNINNAAATTLDAPSFWAHRRLANQWMALSGRALDRARQHYIERLFSLTTTTAATIPPAPSPAVAAVAPTLLPCSPAVATGVGAAVADIALPTAHIVGSGRDDLGDLDDDWAAGLSPEYVEFVRITQQHRKQREKQRRNDALDHAQAAQRTLGPGTWLVTSTAEAVHDDYVLASEIGIHGFVPPATQQQQKRNAVHRRSGDQQASAKPSSRPSRRPDADAYERHLRTRYGRAGAERIQALESQHECVFNEHFERHQPVLWPNIPLRF